MASGAMVSEKMASDSHGKQQVRLDSDRNVREKVA